MLMTRDEAGRRVPYMPLLRWTDGSLKSDLPTLRLRRLHNVNHFIVSQTNPHVLPFIRPTTGSAHGLVSGVRDYVTTTVRSQMELLARLGGANLPLPLRALRFGLDSWASILEQEYQGNITIVPEMSVWRYAHVTANPKMEAVQRFILEGERATWPRIEMVRNQTLIGRTFDHCIMRLNQHPELRAARRARRPDLSVVRNMELGAPGS
jgi:NTE family protein